MVSEYGSRIGMCFNNRTWTNPRLDVFHKVESFGKGVPI